MENGEEVKNGDVLNLPKRRIHGPYSSQVEMGSVPKMKNELCVATTANKPRSGFSNKSQSDPSLTTNILYVKYYLSCIIEISSYRVQ
jgi:hypothetical protein